MAVKQLYTAAERAPTPRGVIAHADHINDSLTVDDPRPEDLPRVHARPEIRGIRVTVLIDRERTVLVERMRVDIPGEVLGPGWGASRPPAGSTGTTLVGCTQASATSHPPSSSTPTTRPSTESHNPHKSGKKPEALQSKPSRCGGT